MNENEILNEVLINALAARIRAEQMTIDQVPEVYREEIESLIEEVEDANS